MASVTLIDNVARMVQQGNSHDHHARTRSEISAANRREWRPDLNSVTTGQTSGCAERQPECLHSDSRIEPRFVRSFHREPLSTNEKKLVTIDRDELSCFKSGQQDLNCSCSP